MRRRGRRVVVTLAAFFATLVATNGTASVVEARAARASAPVVERSPERVLAGYVAALAALRRPAALSFEYTLSQLGLHDMEQSHRVYRRGLDERDETLVVDGYALKAPSVRILRNRSYRYDVTATAPRPAQYAFAFAGTTAQGGELAYRFRTRPTTPRAFEVLAVDIDGRTSLPSVISFRIAGGGARGRGVLRYALSDGRWVIREANVTVRLARGTTARERISWSSYRFFDSLPASTFEAPRPNPSASPNLLAPAAAATPPPALPPNP